MAEYNDRNTDRKTGKAIKQYAKDRPDTNIDRGKPSPADTGTSAKTIITGSQHMQMTGNYNEAKQLAELDTPQKKK